MKNKIKILSVLFVLASFIPQAFGANEVPGRDSAGAEQERFLENEKRDKAEKAMQKRLKTEELVPEEKETEVPEDTGVKFDLKQIKFSGNEQISTAELDSVVSDYIGKKIGMGGLKKAALSVKQYYRQKGYIAAYVYVPPQDVNDGIVEISVIEGKLGNVEIKGNKWFSTWTLRRMAGFNPGSVLYYSDLRKALSYFNKNRDLHVTSLLKPGQEPKTTDLELDVKDKFPLHLSTDVNNLGTNDTGKNRWGIALTDTNLTGLMDELSARFQISDGSIGVGTRYAVPLHSSGTTLSLNYSYSRVHLKNDLRPLDIVGNAHTYGFDVFQPVYKDMFPGDVFAELGVNAGFDFKSIENTIQGRKAGNDELRILNLGMNGEFTDSWGRTFFPNSIHIGFADFLGGSDVNETSPTRAETGGQFFAYRGSLIRYQKLPYDLLMSLRSTWQATTDTLSPSEQFRLGGAFSVRGYQEGAYLADYGILFSAEIYVPTYFFPEDWKLPYSSEPLRKQIQGVAFFDIGGGGLTKTLPGERDSRVLSGAGGGVRIHLFDRVYGRFQWAGRTGQQAGTSSRSAFYYGISAELF